MHVLLSFPKNRDSGCCKVREVIARKPANASCTDCRLNLKLNFIRNSDNKMNNIPARNGTRQLYQCLSRTIITVIPVNHTVTVNHDDSQNIITEHYYPISQKL
ncbi:hypothetical protein QTP88_002315 [Uroleucon formosanum]